MRLKVEALETKCDITQVLDMACFYHHYHTKNNKMFLVRRSAMLSDKGFFALCKPLVIVLLIDKWSS